MARTGLQRTQSGTGSSCRCVRAVYRPRSGTRRGSQNMRGCGERDDVWCGEREYGILQDHVCVPSPPTVPGIPTDFRSGFGGSGASLDSGAGVGVPRLRCRAPRAACGCAAGSRQGGRRPAAPGGTRLRTRGPGVEWRGTLPHFVLSQPMWLSPPPHLY